MDKRKRGHSGVTLPRVLLPLLASSNRYADLGLPVHLRKCSLSLSVCPLARTTVRACVRACTRAPSPSASLSTFPPATATAAATVVVVVAAAAAVVVASYVVARNGCVSSTEISIRNRIRIDQTVGGRVCSFFFLSRGRRVRVLDFWGGFERDSG